MDDYPKINCYFFSYKTNKIRSCFVCKKYLEMCYSCIRDNRGHDKRIVFRYNYDYYYIKPIDLKELINTFLLNYKEQVW
jgi:hypothetical protein